MSITEEATPRLVTADVSGIIQRLSDAIVDLPEPDWLVKGLIERGTLGQIFSEWNVGKSALAVDIACRVALGLPVAGCATTAGPALYIGQEGRAGLLRRFKAWEILNGKLLSDSLYRTVISVQLPDRNIEKQLLTAKANIEQRHRHLALVIVDTVAKTHKGDTRDGADMTAYLSALDRIFPDPAVMLLHHSGHTDKSRGRGASELPAACDWEYKLGIEDEKAKIIKLENTKQRDWEQHRDLYFQLVSVNLDTDEDGEDFGSVVVQHLGDYQAQEPSKGLSATEEKMLDNLQRLTDQHQAHLLSEGHDPSGARVLEDDWRKACSEVKDSTFRGLKRRLREKGCLRQDGSYVAVTDVYSVTNVTPYKGV